MHKNRQGEKSAESKTNEAFDPWRIFMQLTVFNEHNLLIFSIQSNIISTDYFIKESSVSKLEVYSIGNILIDILADVEDSDLAQLKLDKGIMKLVAEDERTAILNHIESKDKVYNCGGSAPNTVIALASLGVKAGLSGKVGHDELGDKYISQLEDHGAKSFVSAEADGVTGTSIILISPDSERTMNTSLGINQAFNKTNVDPSAIKDADYFHFTGYMWDTDNQKEALLEAIKIAEENKTKIAFDLADPFAVERGKKDFMRLIEKHYNIVFANAEEAKILFDDDNPEKNAKRLNDICDIALVKDGKHGSYVASGGKIYNIPVHKVDSVVDSTGEGDIYASGFLFGQCKGYDLEKSGRFASWLASLIVQEMGAQFHEEKLQMIRAAIKDGSWNNF